MSDILEKFEDLLKRVGVLEQKQILSEERQKNANKAIENMEKDFKYFVEKTFHDFVDEQKEQNKQSNKFQYIATGITITLQVVFLPIIMYIIIESIKG